MEVSEPLRSLFWGRIGSMEDCWVWIGYKVNSGYGYFKHKGTMYPAHRVSYWIHKGKVPEGLCLDHLCRNKGCVNPEHLEAVTNKENVLRGVGISAQNARKTHCARGHEFTPENTYNYKGNRSYRCCRKCNVIRNSTTKKQLNLEKE